VSVKFKVEFVVEESLLEEQTGDRVALALRLAGFWREAARELNYLVKAGGSNVEAAAVSPAWEGMVSCGLGRCQEGCGHDEVEHIVGRSGMLRLWIWNREILQRLNLSEWMRRCSEAGLVV